MTFSNSPFIWGISKTAAQNQIANGYISLRQKYKGTEVGLS